MLHDQSLQPGTRLSGGKFIIDRLIGRGGFSFIYEGRIIYRLDLDNELVGLQAEEKPVVIKELYNKDYAQRSKDGISLQWNDDNRPLEERFSEKIKSKTRSEAIKLRNLRHTNILHIIGAVEENNTIYQITQKIEGAVDLSKKLGLGTEVAEKLPLVQARKYILELVQALKLVHSLNIIHLDIKPENILIDQEDRAILIDFGISMTLDSNDYKVSSIILNAASRPWAPVEQYSITDRNSVGFESDIYALGQTIYALLTGIVPPDHTSILSGTAALVAPSEYNREVSDYLDRVISKCVEMKRAHRYQTIEDFERAFCGEAEYSQLVVRAEAAAREKQWAETIALLNEAEGYIPLPYELEELRRNCIHSLTEQDIAQHLAEARHLISQKAYSEAKQKLDLLPKSVEVSQLISECNKLLNEQRLADLIEQADQAIVKGNYPLAEGLVEQVLTIDPKHRIAISLSHEIAGDSRLLDLISDDYDFIRETKESRFTEIQTIYEKAETIADGHREKRLSQKLASLKTYGYKAWEHAMFLVEMALPPRGDVETTLRINQTSLELIQGLYAPFTHINRVVSLLKHLEEIVACCQYLLDHIPAEETKLQLGHIPAEETKLLNQISVLQARIAYLTQSLEWLSARRQGNHSIYDYFYREYEYLLQSDRDKLKKCEGVYRNKQLVSVCDRLLKEQNFEELRNKLNSPDAKYLTPEQKKKYQATLPRKSNFIKKLLRWCLYIVLALIAGLFLLGLLFSESSEPYSSSDTIDSVILVDTDSIVQSKAKERMKQEEERRARVQAEAEIRKQQEAQAAKLKKEAEAKAQAEKQRKEQEEARVAKLKQEAEAKAQAERQRKEQEEANRKKALQLVQQAEKLFANRELEQACQLYIKANKLSKGSGNIGAERFERLATSLSDDTSAPAYTKAKERAARIRASR